MKEVDYEYCTKIHNDNRTSENKPMHYQTELKL